MYKPKFVNITCKNHIILSIWALTILLKINAQQEVIHHPQLQFLFADSLLKQNNYHSSFKPEFVSHESYYKYFGVSESGTRSVLLKPALSAIIDYSKQNKSLLYNSSQGFHSYGKLGGKISFDLTASLHEQHFSDSQTDTISKYNLIPGFNKPIASSGNLQIFPEIRGFVQWQTNPYLNLKIGNDKQFWGDGHRSLFLSENAAAYPFAQLNLNVWNVQYSFQTLFLSDVVSSKTSHRFDKYISMHQLSYNVTRWLSIYAFEAVVWRAEDTVRHRRIDFNYINPFLFLRPIEYNLGSPDNMLFGLGGKIRFGEKSFIYGQLLLDEFRFKELAANKGWWGNKYGIQLGFKTYGLLAQHKSMFLLELNHITPYTYAHVSSLENFGYLKKSLAHPYGTNLDEGLMVIRLAINNRYSIHMVTDAIRYGLNPTDRNLGGDIYASTRNYALKYGNKTGQGITTYDVSQSILISRILIPSWRLSSFIGVDLLIQRQIGENHFNPSVSLGIETLLYE